MDWQDEGLIIGVRNHGETSSIVEAMTARHGRHLGLVRGGRSTRLRPILQPGNSVQLTWRARLAEHLGVFNIEPVVSRTADIMSSQSAVYGIQLLASHLRLLPERDPHEGLYNAALVILEHLDDPALGSRLLIRFELAMLEELGFGLDLEKCAGTGAKDRLTWVSPKTGRAVSQEAGAPWSEKLLPLPAFLINGEPETLPDNEFQDVIDGFHLTGYFLDREIYRPRGLSPPDAREGYLKSVRKILRSQG